MFKSSLILAGSGIKALAHLSPEAQTYIRHADKVLYLVNEPVTQEWICQNNANAESLDDLYFSHVKRLDAYTAITEHILQQLRQEQHICVVLYGHPSVFAKPGLDAVKQARAEGYAAFILPAISAEDCLFADLLINPGSCGCQYFDATDFLVYQRCFDPNSHLILWQVNAIGALGQVRFHNNRQNLAVLTQYLSNHYPLTHLVTLYAAAQYPGLKPQIQTLQLHDLPTATLSQVASLYIPPLALSLPNPAMIEQLGMEITPVS